MKTLLSIIARHIVACVSLIWAGSISQEILLAQNVFYPAAFNHQEVTLLDSPFKRAQEKNYQTLMEYDVDRLLTPYVRQSGLSATTDAGNRYFQWELQHPPFESFAWNPTMAMDGHMLGHYLSALSLAYASCHDEAQRRGFKERLEYIIQVLDDCQMVFDADKRGMKGFLGGIPDNNVWTGLLNADATVYNERGHWVPFYCEHKIMGGLRDAFVFAQNQQAKVMLHKMCDWVVRLTSSFKEGEMEQQILQWETGGMNEIMADAYDLFGDSKYLKTAMKFSHSLVMENMNDDPNHHFLDKKHTNELTAMFLGFSRISKLKVYRQYKMSVVRFWNEVVNRRAMAIGGVGVGGYFVPEDQSLSVITDGDGPDLCTSYNLMKLTESLFADERNAKYVDYYEKVMLNHILASIDPETGGFTYFTSMRPESYRIYSKMNEAMWCCVGTGMESQSKYGEFIYARSATNDTLYVNLFVASQLKADKMTLTQETLFPYGNRSRIVIEKTGNYELAVRHPSWATSGFQVLVNGKPVKYKPELSTPGHPSYIFCGKGWKNGDEIVIYYPMELNFVACPKNSDYIALRYGPTLLAAQTSSRNQGDPRYELLPREYGGAGQHDFSPQTREHFQSLAYAPMLICEMQEVPSRIRTVNLDRLEFEVDASAAGSSWKMVRMRPFFDLHHTRYAIYWNRQSPSVWLRNPLFKNQLRNAQMETLTLDQVEVGEAESEKAHHLKSSDNASGGSWNGSPFRDAQPNQWFEYTLDCSKAASVFASKGEVALVCTLSSSDRGRSCIISIDGQDLAYYEVPSFQHTIGKSRFFEQSFKIPDFFFAGKHSITVRISSTEGSIVPRLYQLRLMKYKEDLLQ